jgi:murein L,D-transpeptidase YafK
VKVKIFFIASLYVLIFSMGLSACSTRMPSMQAGYQLEPVSTVQTVKWTVSDRMKQYASVSKRYFQPYFRRLGIPYLSGDLAVVILKKEKRMQLYVNHNGTWHYLHSFPVLGMSGRLGPKLKQGDRQVPEGMYEIIGFNPNSRFFLSLELNYPNQFDQLQASKAGRTNLGNNIFIHGSDLSRGCIAMGDKTMEYLFPLIVSYARKNTTWGGDIPVLIAPYDFRMHHITQAHDFKIPWVSSLYDQMSAVLMHFPSPH